MKLLYAAVILWGAYNFGASIVCQVEGGTPSPFYWPPVTQCYR